MLFVIFLLLFVLFQRHVCLGLLSSRKDLFNPPLPEKRFKEPVTFDICGRLSSDLVSFAGYPVLFAVYPVLVAGYSVLFADYPVLFAGYPVLFAGPWD